MRSALPRARGDAEAKQEARSKFVAHVRRGSAPAPVGVPAVVPGHARDSDVAFSPQLTWFARLGEPDMEEPHATWPASATPIVSAAGALTCNLDFPGTPCAFPRFDSRCVAEAADHGRQHARDSEGGFRHTLERPGAPLSIAHVRGASPLRGRRWRAPVWLGAPRARSRRAAVHRFARPVRGDAG